MCPDSFRAFILLCRFINNRLPVKGSMLLKGYLTINKDILLFLAILSKYNELPNIVLFALLTVKYKSVLNLSECITKT